MTTENAPAKPGAMNAYFRADAASRQVVLQIGLGVVSFIVGSILSVGASARITERIGFIESETVALLLRWFFERLWLFTVLPAFGYVLGRFTETKPTRFALVGGLSGEVFAVLLVTAINGFDFLFDDVPALIARAVTLFLGLVVTTWAVQAGQEVSAEAQVEADAIAEKKKAEYAAFLAAAEGKGDGASSPLPPAEAQGEAQGDGKSVNPHPDPLPKGEGDTAPGDGDKKS
jgi:hypothetical protein